MPDTFYILPLERSEFEQKLQTAAHILKEKDAIYKQAEAQVPKPTFDTIKVYNKYITSIENIAEKNPAYNPLIDKYDSFVNEFDQQSQQNYNQVAKWFLDELTSLRDKNDGWIAFNRPDRFNFCKGQSIDETILANNQEYLDFELHTTKTYWGSVLKQYESMEVTNHLKNVVNDKVKYLVNNITGDFKPLAIKFHKGNVTEAYEDFKKCITSKYGERLVSVDEMKQLYERGLGILKKA